jgi:hypothetical protein
LRDIYRRWGDCRRGVNIGNDVREHGICAAASHHFSQVR